MTTPWLVQIYSAKMGVNAGRASGITYAVSTVGGVAGALASGLWMLPALGLWQTALVSVWVLAAAAAVCAAGSEGRRLLGAAPPACL